MTFRAHSKTEYKRLVTQGANVLPPNKGDGLMKKLTPVAWIAQGGTGDLWWHNGSESDMPLYLEPQKEWVDLTADEATIIWERVDERDGWELIMQVQKALKEKNT